MMLTEEEQHDLDHNMRWGSDGYPLSKVKSGWLLKHFPKVFKTKKSAGEQWEKYIDILLDKKANRI